MKPFDPFSGIPVKKLGRTNFDEAHEVSGNFPLSKVCPVFTTETIPGDSWDVNVFNITKLETLLAPAMQRVNASLLWFKVEKRLLFKHYKKWYTGGADGQDSHEKPHIYLWQFAYELRNYSAFASMSDAQLKELTNVLFGPGSLWNYLQLPVPLSYDSGTGVWSVLSIKDWSLPVTEEARKSDESYIDIMPFLGYHLIYDQYFRDQSLSQSCFEDSEEGVLKVENKYNQTLKVNANSYTLPNVTGTDLSEGGEVNWKDFIRLLFLFNRAWKKEYFTSALPTPQRGPEVTIPFTDEATVPVSINNGQPVMITDAEGVRVAYDDGVTVGDNLKVAGDNELIGTDDAYLTKIAGKLFKTDSSYQPSENPILGTADLSGLSPITITAFRNLFKLQQFLEKNNIAGGRYIETILAHWGERVPDFTVQRATHLRSTSLPVQISPVVATANSTGVNSQVGDQAGRAAAQGNLGKVHFYTQEACWVFGLYVVTAPPSYANQGIPRMYQRITRFDEPWRDFQHIGEQAIKNRELFFDFAGTEANYNSGDFGYQQRFSEFKYMPDRIVGDFQTSLAYWHMARMFSGPVHLNGDFIKQTLDERIFAVQNSRPVTADFYFDAKAKRKLSKFSTPKLT